MLYELLSLATSIVAIIISAAALVRTRKIAEKQLDLEKSNADLSEKQLSIITADEERRKYPEIDVELVGSGSKYKLFISNRGYSEALDVEFSLSGMNTPIAANEFKEKTPIPILRPGKTVAFSAYRAIDSDAQYDVNLKWVNPDGSLGNDKVLVYWQ